MSLNSRGKGIVQNARRLTLTPVLPFLYNHWHGTCPHLICAIVGTLPVRLSLASIFYEFFTLLGIGIVRLLVAIILVDAARDLCYLSRCFK